MSSNVPDKDISNNYHQAKLSEYLESWYTPGQYLVFIVTFVISFRLNKFQKQLLLSLLLKILLFKQDEIVLQSQSAIRLMCKHSVQDWDLDWTVLSIQWRSLRPSHSPHISWPPPAPDWFISPVKMRPNTGTVRCTPVHCAVEQMDRWTRTTYDNMVTVINFSCENSTP